MSLPEWIPHDLPPFLLQNEDYMKMLYDQFRTNTNGTFGDLTILFDRMTQVLPEHAKGCVYVGVGEGAGLSDWRKVLNCTPGDFVVIDGNAELLRHVDKRYNPVHAVIATAEAAAGTASTVSAEAASLPWFRTSHRDLNGCTKPTNAILAEYGAVELPPTTVEIKTLDEVVESVEAGSRRNVLIIDVPNSELNILGSATLSSCEVVAIRSYRDTVKGVSTESTVKEWLTSRGFQHIVSQPDSALTTWTLFTRFAPPSTSSVRKWYLSVELDNPQPADVRNEQHVQHAREAQNAVLITRELYKLVAGWSIARRRGYHFVAPAACTPLIQFLASQVGVPRAETVKAGVKWHTVVCCGEDDETQYVDPYLPPHKHTLLRGSFRNPRYAEEMSDDDIHAFVGLLNVQQLINTQKAYLDYLLHDFVPSKLESRSDYEPGKVGIAVWTGDAATVCSHLSPLKQAWIGVDLSGSETPSASSCVYVISKEFDSLKPAQKEMAILGMLLQFDTIYTANQNHPALRDVLFWVAILRRGLGKDLTILDVQRTC